MFLTNYSRCVQKLKFFLPKSYIKSSGLFKEISNEPLQKPNAESNFANKAVNLGQQEESFEVNKNKEKVNYYVNLNQPDNAAQEAASTQIPSSSLIPKRDITENILNADPFEEIPGPAVLNRISQVWKYLPEIGCQATVSFMLSSFNVAQKLSSATKLTRHDARPFDFFFRKYGPIVRLGPLGTDVVLICKPEHVAKIFEQEGRHPIRATLDSVEKCRSQTRKNVEGPFNVSGVEWEEIRRTLQEPLLKGSQKYFEAIESTAEMFVRRIRAIRNRQQEVPDNFMVEITKWSVQCLCHVILGKSLGFFNPENVHANSEPQRLLNAIVEATQHICKCESGFQLWRFMNTPSIVGLSQACEVIDTFIAKHIRLAQVNLTKNKEEILNREKREGGLPFVEHLLLNECMSPDEVLTCIIDLLLIGANTTSSSLGFTLYHLAQNQRSQRILFKEMKENFPEKDSPMEYEHLSSLKYLNACINESLRLKMPMPTLTRVLPNDIVLSNYRIPRGTYMVMDIQAAGLKEQNFEKFDKFLPERWFEPSNILPFSFIPFGHGIRCCIGKQLAEVQLKTCVARIIRNYQVEYNYGEIQGTRTVISFPDKPLKLCFTEREE